MKVNGVGILLDCGWDIKFDVADIQPLAACLPQVSWPCNDILMLNMLQDQGQDVLKAFRQSAMPMQ